MQTCCSGMEQHHVVGRCSGEGSTAAPTLISDSWRVRTVRLARCSSRGVMRCVATVRRTRRLAAMASWIFCGVDVTLTTNQPCGRRSNSDSSNDTSYVRPSASRTCSCIVGICSQLQSDTFVTVYSSALGHELSRFGSNSVAAHGRAQTCKGWQLTVVNRRLLMTSVSSDRQTLANSGWLRRAAREASSSSRELNAPTCAGGGTLPGAATVTSGLKAPQRLGAGPAMYAHARSSESCAGAHSAFSRPATSCDLC